MAQLICKFLTCQLPASFSAAAGSILDFHPEVVGGHATGVHYIYHTEGDRKSIVALWCGSLAQEAY